MEAVEMIPMRMDTADNPNLIRKKEEYAAYYRGLPKKADWLSYYHQIELILSIDVDNFLEIGGGGMVVTDFFRRRDFKVITLDLNAPFRPSVVGSVNRLPLKDASTDCILCCQVLEHLPLSELDTCLSEFFRVTRKHVVMSLPLDAEFRSYHIDLPKIHWNKSWIKERTEKENYLRGYHYWELGRKGSAISSISARIRKNWKIRHEYVCEDNPNHYFYCLEKAEG